MKKRLVKLGVTLGLVAAVGVGGTLAALSQTSGPVTNTFAVGYNIKSDDFSIKETNVKFENGNYVYDTVNKQANPTKTANSYANVLPKATLAKDPTVIFNESKVDDMPAVYMFVKVDGLDDIYMSGKGLSIADNGWGTEWKKVSLNEGAVSTTDASQFENGEKDGIYVYEESSGNRKIVPKNLTASSYKLPAVFTSLKVSGDFEMSFEGVNNIVKITACAVQYDNVDLAEAYTLANQKLNPTTTSSEE